MLNLISGNISYNNLWEELSRLLDAVDADFTGTNGEEYYTTENISFMESAIRECAHMDEYENQIVHVLECCKDYSSNYYDEFKYQILDASDNSCYIIIATTN